VIFTLSNYNKTEASLQTVRPAQVRSLFRLQLSVANLSSTYVIDVLYVSLSVDSCDEVKNLNRINKNNFARLPRAKRELSEQMSTAVCQFLATCMFTCSLSVSRCYSIYKQLLLSHFYLNGLFFQSYSRLGQILEGLLKDNLYE